METVELTTLENLLKIVFGEASVNCLALPEEFLQEEFDMNADKAVAEAISLGYCAKGARNQGNKHVLVTIDSEILKKVFDGEDVKVLVFSPVLN